MILEGEIMWLVRAIIRGRKSLRRRWKLFTLRVQYGNKFYAEKIEFRRNLNVEIVGSGKLVIGKDVFFNNNCSINVLQKVIIGKNCIFGENVKIYDHNHRYLNKDCLIRTQGFVTDEIIIEEDCWIGSNVVILKGVHIGKHSVIGAGVIVYKDIPAYSVVICKQNLESSIMC